jgi:NAD(P)-dependent dehydrogenase (short-subunit alcohol dehydrogenase family)
MGTLDGKLVLVTGAGTGIGHGIALECAHAGASVVFHYASSGKGAQEAVDDLTRAGSSAKALQADLSRVEECRRLVDEAAEFLGGLDILVNNAGVSRIKPFLETTPDEYDFVLNLNMRGYFFCAQRAVTYLVARGGGSILNISSGQAIVGIPGHAAYAATKGAIVSFTRELAVELAPRRIRVNALGPGLIEVPRLFKDLPGYSRERGAAQIPWGRVGFPEDIGRVAAFVVSDAADFITGQMLYVDGGTTATIPNVV